MTFSEDQRALAVQMRREKADARKAQREVLKGGWVLSPDSPPGIGWVLEEPASEKGHPGKRRYFATREGALARHQELVP